MPELASSSPKPLRYPLQSRVRDLGREISFPELKVGATTIACLMPEPFIIARACPSYGTGFEQVNYSFSKEKLIRNRRRLLWIERSALPETTRGFGEAKKKGSSAPPDALGWRERDACGHLHEKRSFLLLQARLFQEKICAVEAGLAGTEMHGNLICCTGRAQ